MNKTNTTDNPNCLFCKIINNEIPSYKVYEDELFYVMLDRFPKCLGHTLILTKSHASTLFDLQRHEMEQMTLVMHKVATALKSALNFDGLNIFQNNGAAAGQEIDHFHFHLVPRYENDGFSFNISHNLKEPSHKDFEETALKISEIIRRLP